MLDTRYGAAIHYEVTGSGPPVILIHGWPLTGDMREYRTSSPMTGAVSGIRRIRPLREDRFAFLRSFAKTF